MLQTQHITWKSKYYRVFLRLRCNKYSTETQIQPAEPVKYPEIKDVSPRGIFRQQQETYFEKIKALGTVEEKMIALNMPRYWGWNTFILKEGVLPYNSLPFAQFLTRTVISQNRNLPLFRKDEKMQALLPQMKKELEKVVLFEHSAKRFRHEVETKFYEKEEDEPYRSESDINEIKTKHFVKQLNSAFTRVLAPQYPHLLSAQVDFDPRLEAFWRVGGFYPTENDLKLRKEKEIPEIMLDDHIDRFFQYFGKPLLQLRSRQPLPVLPKIEIKREYSESSVDESSEPLLLAGSKNVESGESFMRSSSTGFDLMVGESQLTVTDESSEFYPLQEYRYAPDLYLGIPRERMHGVIIPGFWPNDPNRFGLVSFLSGSHLLNRPAHYGSQDAIEALHAQALLASYAWAYGMACYQGFTTYNDITYPFTTQTVITDGRMFSFYQYRLNTITLHTDLNDPSNPQYNECYATVPMELFHEVGVDGVRGWNEEAILNLLAVYTNTPAVRESVDLCPYLNKEERLIAHIRDDARRVFLFKNYMFLTSHRGRTALPPEIYDWERIYKIENQRRVTDARKRFFEKFEDPLNDRKFNDHKPPYICRRDRKVNKIKKYADQFYPEVFPEYHEIV